jgi:hypothetical protein
MNDSILTGEQYFSYRSQFLRGICILAVVVIHTFMLTDEVDTLPFSFLHLMCMFAVPLFFVLASFNLALTRKKRNRNRQAAIQMTIVYLFYRACYSFFSYYLKAPAEFDPTTFLVITLKQTINPGATIFSLMLVYIQILLVHNHLYSLFLSYRKIINFKFLILIFSAQLLLQIGLFLVSFSINGAEYPTLQFLIETIGFSFPCYIGYLFLGYYLRENASSMKNMILRKKTTLIYLVILFWVVFASYFVARSYDYVNSTIWGMKSLKNDILDILVLPVLVISGFGMLLKLYDLLQSHKVLTDLISKFGLYSFGIYYLHRFVHRISLSALPFETHTIVTRTMYSFALLVITLFATLYLAKFISHFKYVGKYLV